MFSITPAEIKEHFWLGLSFGGSIIPEPSTTTDANGNYAFTNLVPGNYAIGVDNSRGQFADGTPSEFVQTVSVGVSSTNASVDFGVVRRNRPNALLGFNDRNGKFLSQNPTGQRSSTTLMESTFARTSTAARYGSPTSTTTELKTPLLETSSRISGQ